MNNRPPLNEPITDDNGIVTRGWSNWWTQVFSGLAGWKRSFNYSFTIDFGSISANSTLASSGLTVPGVRSGDVVMVTPSTQTSGVIYTANVTANDQVKIYANNITTGSINPASTVFTVVVLQD